MTKSDLNEQNFFLQMQVKRLEQENADLKGEILQMLMAWGVAQDEIKKLKDQPKSR